MSVSNFAVAGAYNGDSDDSDDSDYLPFAFAGDDNDESDDNNSDSELPFALAGDEDYDEVYGELCDYFPKCGITLKYYKELMRTGGIEAVTAAVVAAQVPEADG
jgi:hypothetical protein